MQRPARLGNSCEVTATRGHAWVARASCVLANGVPAFADFPSFAMPEGKFVSAGTRKPAGETPALPGWRAGRALTNHLANRLPYLS